MTQAIHVIQVSLLVRLRVEIETGKNMLALSIVSLLVRLRVEIQILFLDIIICIVSLLVRLRVEIVFKLGTMDLGESASS